MAILSKVLKTVLKYIYNQSFAFTLWQGSPEQSSQNKKVLAKDTASYIPQSDCEVIKGHFPSNGVVPLPEDGEERKQQDYATPGQ